MLKIFTESGMSDKEYLFDVEAEFRIQEPIIEELYRDSLSVYILKSIEGMTDRKGKYIDSKFGTISIMDVSTGAKTLLLCANRYAECIINANEMGTNAIKVLAEISKQIDIEVVINRVLKYFEKDFECFVNGEYCKGEDISYALAEILGDDL